MADPFEHFIDPLRAVFADPPTAAAKEAEGDATKFYAALAVDIRDFEADVLQEAAKRLRDDPPRGREGRSFPMIDRCMAYCRQAASDIEARKRAAAREKTERAPSHESFAEEQMSSDLARRAARVGWVSSFRDFCATHGRLPDELEIEIIRAERKRVLAFAEEQAASGSRILVTAFQAMLRREENLSRRVLSAGEKVA